MKMNQLEIGINAHNEILLSQVSNTQWNIIRITPAQAETVAEEIKKLAKQLKEEQNGKE